MIDKIHRYNAKKNYEEAMSILRAISIKEKEASEQAIDCLLSSSDSDTGYREETDYKAKATLLSLTALKTVKTSGEAIEVLEAVFEESLKKKQGK